MIDPGEIIALVSDSRDSTASLAQFLEGTLLGAVNIRPSDSAQEAIIVESLRHRLPKTEGLSPNAHWSDGVKFGVNLRIKSERDATEVYKYLSGSLPSKFLKRVFSRRSRLKLLLSDRSALERKLMQEAFYARYFRNLENDIRSIFSIQSAQELCSLLTAPTTPEVAKKLASRSRRGIAFTPDQLRISIQKKGPLWLGLYFLGRSSAERMELLQSYEKEFGASLIEKVKQAYRGWERELILDLINQGNVSWAKLLYICVRGVGTDEVGLLELLEAMEPHEISEARHEFRSIWEANAPWYERLLPRLMGDLEKRIWIETGGDVWFDLCEYFVADKSKSQSIEARLLRLHEHELSGYLLKKLDFFSREGKLLNRDVAQVREFYRTFIANGNADLAVWLRFEALMDYIELDCSVFRAFKHFVGNMSTNVVATITAGSAAFALTAMHYTVGTIMMVVGIISISLRLILKTVLKGRGYHRGEIGADLFFGTIDGLTLFATHLFRQALIRFSTRFLTKLGLKTGILQISRFMGESRTAHLGVRLSELGN